MEFDTLKMSIEDNAFSMWECDKDGETYEESAKNFAKEYLDKFPGFQDKWGVDSLAKQLMERL